MDHHAFDSVTRLFGTTTSRRTTWRALLAAALFGATTRPAAAASRCPNGKPACGDACCPGKCFRDENTHAELCCDGLDVTGKALIICGNTCCQDVGESPCDCCRPPGFTSVITASEIAATADPCPDLIAGSYRRR